MPDHDQAQDQDQAPPEYFLGLEDPPAPDHDDPPQTADPAPGAEY